MLERIADSLPGNVDRALVNEVLFVLTRDLPLLHRDENEGLIPLLQNRCEPGEPLFTMLERMIREHGADQGFADETIEALQPLASGGSPQNPEMLGYMLRGFFESYRRHLGWERDVVLPEAAERLTRGDLLELESKMRVHRADRDLATRIRGDEPRETEKQSDRATGRRCGID